jgi:hypothetical protein
MGFDSDEIITAASNSPSSPFHIVLASFGSDAKLSIIDSRYAKDPIISWSDLSSSKIAGVQSIANDSLITWSRHEADIQLFSCNSPSPPQSLSSFHESKDYSSFRPTCRVSVTMPRNDWPPLMGLVARTRGDGIECFTQSFDGAVYRQRYFDEDEIEEPNPVIDLGEEDVVEEEEEEIQEKSYKRQKLKEQLSRRDIPAPGKIQFGGFATKLYPPAPLGSEMEMRVGRELHLHNIWRCMFYNC